MTTTVACPSCDTKLELIDMLDICPPIPTRAWPQRWHIHNGEGGSTSSCPACGEDLAATEIAVAAGLPADYPWTRVVA